MAKLKKLSSFIEDEFEEGEAPTKKTLRKAIDNGVLAGKRVGTQYFVDMQKFNSTGNSTVDRILAAS